MANDLYLTDKDFYRNYVIKEIPKMIQKKLSYDKTTDFYCRLKIFEPTILIYDKLEQSYNDLFKMYDLRKYLNDGIGFYSMNLELATCINYISPDALSMKAANYSLYRNANDLNSLFVYIPEIALSIESNGHKMVNKKERISRVIKYNKAHGINNIYEKVRLCPSLVNGQIEKLVDYKYNTLSENLLGSDICDLLYMHNTRYAIYGY